MRKTNYYLLFVSLIFINCGSILHANNGWALINDKKYNEAILEFNIAKKDKELPGIYSGLYSAYRNKGQMDSALKYLSIGLDKFPDDGFINLTFGVYYLRNEKDADPQKALKFLEKARKSRLGNVGSSIRDNILEYIIEAEAKIKNK